MVGATNKMKGGDTFLVRWGHCFGHCFVLRDLSPMSFFKKVVIIKLKMCTTDKTFSKICLKTIRYFFPTYGMQSRERWSKA